MSQLYDGERQRPRSGARASAGMPPPRRKSPRNGGSGRGRASGRTRGSYDRRRRRSRGRGRLLMLLGVVVLIVVLAVVGKVLRSGGKTQTQPVTTPTSGVTLTAGRTRAQIGKLLQQQGVKGSYVKATVSSALLDPIAYGAPKDTPTLEGFLWPGNYVLRRPWTISELVSDQLQAFKRNFAAVSTKYAQARGLTPYDVVIIASLIQGEALLPGDFGKVASVVYNRLHLGMYLGLDSTVAYATGNYGDLTAKDLASGSAWNTINHKGLPPTPIDNPGAAAIETAATPPTTGYLYFINKVCGNGRLLFTASYARFLVWSGRWQRALRKAEKDGGSAEFCTAAKSGTTTQKPASGKPAGKSS